MLLLVDALEALKFESSGSGNVKGTGGPLTVERVEVWGRDIRLADCDCDCCDDCHRCDPSCGRDDWESARGFTDVLLVVDP